MKSIFFSTKYELMHFNRNYKKFNLKTTINLEEMQLTSKIDIKTLKLQINTKLK